MLLNYHVIPALLLIASAKGWKENSENFEDGLTVPIFRLPSRDYLSPVFYQKGNKNSDTTHEQNVHRQRRQIYGSPWGYSSYYRTTPRPSIFFGYPPGRRLRGGGGRAPRPNRNRGRLPILGRPGIFGGNHGSRSRGGPRGGIGRGRGGIGRGRGGSGRGGGGRGGGGGGRGKGR